MSLRATALASLALSTGLAAQHNVPWTHGEDAEVGRTRMFGGKAGAQDPVAPPMLLRAVESGGETRWYRVHVPAGSENGDLGALPVVLAFHGGGGNAVQFADSTDLFVTADREGFLLVYPEGSGPLAGWPTFALETWNAGNCCAAAAAWEVDDVQFVRDLVDDLTIRWEIDLARVFATGHSNGGMMSYRLGVEAPDLVRAIAPNAASLGVAGLPAQPVPMLVMHGLLDENVPWEGGVGSGPSETYFASQLQSLAPFATVNQVGPWALAEVQGQAQLYRATSPVGAPIHYWWLLDGGHSWPGHGSEIVQPTNFDIDANETIWSFFARF